VYAKYLQNFSPEGFKVALLQKGCLAFRSPAKIDLRLKLTSSLMSASCQARPGDLKTTASDISQLPTGMQTLFASTEAMDSRFTCLWGCLCQLQLQFRIF
jgi:hypothetical protein